MKLEIKNKIYDTNTAIKRAEYNRRCPKDKNYYCTEELYQTKYGDFFLYGCGYFTRCRNSTWCEKIILPMPYEKAKEWSEKSIKMSEYIAIFGEPEKEKKEEKEKSIPLHITLPSSRALKLRKAAKDANMTLSEYINFLIG